MRDADQILVRISFCESHSVSPMEFPLTWNRKIEKEHVRRSKVRLFSQFYFLTEFLIFRLFKLSIAKALLPTLRQEQEHLKAEGIIRRPRETDVRVTCGPSDQQPLLLSLISLRHLHDFPFLNILHVPPMRPRGVRRMFPTGPRAHPSVAKCNSPRDECIYGKEGQIRAREPVLLELFEEERTFGVGLYPSNKVCGS